MSAIYGDTTSIKTLFATDRASPFDVTLDSWDPLHYALFYGRIDTCQFLLQQGADPYLEDSRRLNAFDFAWDAILANHGDHATRQAPSTMFNDPDELERRQFPILHKIVLGLVEMDLVEYLDASTANINDIDGQGRTALTWASARGDVTMVKILLDKGADVNIHAKDRTSSLHWATWARTSTTDVILLLLKAGAKVNPLAHDKFSPMHYASYFPNDVSSLKTLLEYGADMNAGTRGAATPLMFAALNNDYAGTKLLLESHADIDLQDSDGSSTLLYAVLYNSHEVLDILEHANANYLLRDRKGRTILHFAALYSDVRTLQLLTEPRMTGLQLDAGEDDTRMTGMECAQHRQGTTQEWWTAWNGLLDSLDDVNGQIEDVETDGDEEGEDIFEDALEHCSSA